MGQKSISKTIFSLFFCPQTQSSILYHSLKVLPLTFRLSEKKNSEKLPREKLERKPSREQKGCHGKMGRHAGE